MNLRYSFCWSDYFSLPHPLLRKAHNMLRTNLKWHDHFAVTYTPTNHNMIHQQNNWKWIRTWFWTLIWPPFSFLNVWLESISEIITWSDVRVSPKLLTVTLSRSTTNFWIGLSMIAGLEAWSRLLASFRSPTCTFTRLTNPLLSLTVSTTLPNCHWLLGSISSLMITTSFTLRFRRGVCHFWRVEIWRRYSFFQRLQNCSTKYWTLCHRFVAYMSSLTNFPGGGSATSDFISIKWFGVRGSSEFGSLMPSTVSGRLLTIAIAS